MKLKKNVCIYPMYNVHAISVSFMFLIDRYRHEFKSQKLWTEIKFVLDNFAAPLTELFVVSILFLKMPHFYPCNVTEKDIQLK